MQLVITGANDRKTLNRMCGRHVWLEEETKIFITAKSSTVFNKIRPDVFKIRGSLSLVLLCTNTKKCACQSLGSNYYDYLITVSLWIFLLSCEQNFDYICFGAIKKNE